MSFTEDELHSFNTILEQRLNAQLRDMERAFDQRMNEYRRELDQRLLSMHADVQRSVSQKLSDFQVRLETILSEKLNTQPARIIQTFDRDIERRQQQFEGNIERMLAAQILSIEQLIPRLSVHNEPGDTVISAGFPAQLDTVEVQTELAWADLLDVIGKALDDRLSVLNDTMQRSLKNLEQYLSLRLHSMREEFLHNKTQWQGHQALHEENPTNIQDILQGIEHLEQIIESMQVVMTSNHALLSNRLYNHQQLPFERAHSSNEHDKQKSNTIHKSFSITEEHVSNGAEPGGIAEQAQIEE
ncbi:MAG TPA: hypothetical protein VEH81_13640 [Ktedonobacteraceae bacterium]|nr:hypothetical protein [Ktedonobacteraceae bacterium]